MSETVSSVAGRFLANAEVVRSVFGYANAHSCLGGAALLTCEGIYPNVIPLRELHVSTKIRCSASKHSTYVLPQLVSQLYTAADRMTALSNMDQAYRIFEMLFPSSAWCAFSAMILSRLSTPQYYQFLAERTFALFSRQKAMHPLITLRRDIPFSSLMALSDLNDDFLISAEQRYMDIFSRLIVSSDGIQALSQMLSVSHISPDINAERFFNLYVRLGECGIQLGNCMEVLAPVVISEMNIDLFVQNLIEADKILSGSHFFGAFSISSKKHRNMYAAFIAFISLLSDVNIPDYSNMALTSAYCCIISNPSVPSNR